MLRWYLIQTKPSAEATAESNLERQNYKIYLPRALQPVRIRGRWHEKVVPLFPRYLFLRLNEGLQSLAPVRSTVGVTQIVHFGSDPAVVPDAVVSKLQQRVDPTSGLLRISDVEALVPGETVMIGAGPFNGLEGIFQRRAGTDRVVILLNVLGQVTPVRVSHNSLAPAEAM